MTRDTDQEWPTPPCAVDASLPKPWVVAAYFGAALGNVLRSDYGAVWKDGVYYVEGGEMTKVTNDLDLYGRKIGTLFFLADPIRGTKGYLDRIIKLAASRGAKIIRISAIPSRPSGRDISRRIR